MLLVFPTLQDKMVNILKQVLGSHLFVPEPDQLAKDGQWLSPEALKHKVVLRMKVKPGTGFMLWFLVLECVCVRNCVFLCVCAEDRLAGWYLFVSCSVVLLDTFTSVYPHCLRYCLKQRKLQHNTTAPGVTIPELAALVYICNSSLQSYDVAGGRAVPSSHSLPDSKLPNVSIDGTVGLSCL